MIDVEVYAFDGRSLGWERFRVGESPGSGFAGQVYRAEPEGRIRFDGGGVVRPVAIKVLKPRSRLKRLFRDLLFQLSFQTSYAPRLREESLRSGLAWQALLRAAAGIELGARSAVARPLGYFWDASLASFAEVHEWVDGRRTHYEADDGLLLRWLRREPDSTRSEIERKRTFMSALVNLCREIGATGLARQYEWYTLVSQANVLARRPPEAGEVVNPWSEFVAVDCRPGLAVPFFLPLSPAHLRIIRSGFPNGNLAHFDEVDFGKLAAYLADHQGEFGSLAGLVPRLVEDDRRYRAGLPGLWGFTKRSFFSEEHWRAVKAAAIEDRRRLGHISPSWSWRLNFSPSWFLVFFLLDRLPVLGLPLMRLAFHERYREHLWKYLTSPDYFKNAWEAWRAADLLDWSLEGRVSPERCERLAGSFPIYLFDKALLDWLPAGIQRLFSDAEARVCLARSWFLRPFSLVVSGEEREKWLAEILQEQSARGFLGEDQAMRLAQQAAEPRMQGFLRDTGFMLALEAMAKLLYLALAAFGLATRNFLPFSLAAFSPVSPSGLVRTAYVLAQLLAGLPGILRKWDGKLLLARMIGLAAAPWRGLGNLFALLEMFAYYSELSLLLGNVFISRMVATVPVLGGPGKLLEYWAFQAAYNFPLSVRRALLEYPGWMEKGSRERTPERARRR
jgi:hypothetical protein